MFKRKFQALGYCNSADSFSVNDPEQFRNLVVWLEDIKIRHYPVEDRVGLRDISSKDWSTNFESYLKDLECSIDPKDLKAVTDWLLGNAVRLQYEDNAAKYSDKSVGKVNPNVPQMVASNPLDALGFDSDDFKSGVNNLATLLKVTKHPNHLMTLKAISRLIQQKLNSEVIKNPSAAMIEGTSIPLQDIELGFDTGDKILNDAAKILRLLFITDLRQLQTKINEAIVAVQNVTADPKTDSSLGKVGI